MPDTDALPAAPRSVGSRADTTRQAAPDDAGLRARKKHATRRALRLAALRLVDERGLERVTNDDIASAAGVSARTFFNYFASKEDALVGSDPELPGVLAAGVLARPADESPLVALRVVLLEQASTVDVDDEFWRLRARVLHAYPELRAAMVGRSVTVEEHLAAAVATRTGLDEAHPYPRLVANVAATASRTALQHAASTGFRTSFVDALEAALDAVAAGLPVPARD